MIRNVKVSVPSGDSRVSYEAQFFSEKVDILKPTRKNGTIVQEQSCTKGNSCLIHIPWGK